MKVQDAIRQIKVSTHDALDEYSEPHCLDFLNRAITQVASLLSAGGYFPMVKEITLEDGSYLPHNFMKACGAYPIKITNNRIEIIDDDEFEIRFRYFACPEKLTKDTLDMPFSNDAINEVVVSLATMFALNENEFDIQQDTALMQTLQQAVAAGFGYGG